MGMAYRERILSCREDMAGLTRKSSLSDLQLHSHCLGEQELRISHDSASSTLSLVKGPQGEQRLTSLQSGRGLLALHLGRAYNCNHCGIGRDSLGQALARTFI